MKEEQCNCDQALSLKREVKALKGVIRELEEESRALATGQMDKLDWLKADLKKIMREMGVQDGESR